MSTLPIRNPNTIYLGGGDGPGGESGCSVIDDIPISGTGGLPGMFVEYKNVGGAVLFALNAHPTAPVPATVLLDQTFQNQNLDVPYSDMDLAMVGSLKKGSAVWAVLASGQTIVGGTDLLQISAASPGMLAKVSSGNGFARALESITTTATWGRIRVEIV